jgi:hypothetical protein
MEHVSAVSLRVCLSAAALSPPIAPPSLPPHTSTRPAERAATYAASRDDSQHVAAPHPPLFSLPRRICCPGAFATQSCLLRCCVRCPVAFAAPPYSPPCCVCCPVVFATPSCSPPLPPKTGSVEHVEPTMSSWEVNKAPGVRPALAAFLYAGMLGFTFTARKQLHLAMVMDVLTSLSRPRVLLHAG